MTPAVVSTLAHLVTCGPGLTIPYTDGTSSDVPRSQLESTGKDDITRQDEYDTTTDECGIAEYPRRGQGGRYEGNHSGDNDFKDVTEHVVSSGKDLDGTE